MESVRCKMIGRIARALQWARVGGLKGPKEIPHNRAGNEGELKRRQYKSIDAAPRVSIEEFREWVEKWVRECDGDETLEDFFLHQTSTLKGGEMVEMVDITT